MKAELWRVEWDYRKPYDRLNMEVVEYKGLSWEARGVLAYLLARPDNWDIRFRDLLSQAPTSDCELRRILKELVGARYIWLD